jgi:thioredoxin reductase/bacterioferritin-associated ferredoxin
MKTNECDVAVLGGGPAGLSAALTAASGRGSVALIDEDQSLGGHFYKDLPVQFKPIPSSSERAHRLIELQHKREALLSLGVEIIQGARLWGIFQGQGTTFHTYQDSQGSQERFHLYLDHSQNGAQVVKARLLIIAPGVYDRPLPFPGWELPGVYTPGAIQMMLDRQGLLPGRRILVAGSGPLQFVVAAELARAGAEVVALLDTSAASEGIAQLPGVLIGLSSRLGEILGSLSTLLRKQVPILFRHALWRAYGTPQEGVTGALVGRIDSQGHPIAGTERQFDVDTICIAYGFIPSIALTLHLGCAHVFDENLCAYVPLVDDRMQSSRSGVFIAGDVTGVGGKPLAELQGRIAGLSALEQLGKISTNEANRLRARLASAIQREQRFARWLWRRYRLRLGLLDLMTDETLICYCEGVRLGQLRESVNQGARDLYGLKLRTRLGMGYCQGRYCMPNAAAWLSVQTGLPIPKLGMFSVRPPILPVRLKNIANLKIQEFQ